MHHSLILLGNFVELTPIITGFKSAKFRLNFQHRSHSSRPDSETGQRFDTKVNVGCADDGAMFSPNLMQFGPSLSEQ